MLLLPLLMMTPLPTLEPDTCEEICLDSFFFRSNFGTIQSILKIMNVAQCFNGLFDVNVMVKLFSLVIALPNACACQMVRLFSLVITLLG